MSYRITKKQMEAIKEQWSTLGTVLKINIHMEELDGYHLADVDFHVKVSSVRTKKYVTIQKSSAIRIDDDNYIVVVDSLSLGLGRYYLTLYAQIPDIDVDGGLRLEVKTVDTGITINN